VDSKILNVIANEHITLQKQYHIKNSPDSTATRCVLVSPGVEPQWGNVFRAPPGRPRGPPSLLDKGHHVTFQAVKRPELYVNHASIPPPFSVEVRKRVELHLYSSSGP
jgi:hypothetical protein